MRILEKNAPGYLAAMIDGEGSVTFHRAGYSRGVKIVNTDPAIIQACKDCCDYLGIGYTTHQPTVKRLNRKQQTVLTIYGRANLERLNSVISLQAPEKARRLEELVSSYTYNQIDHEQVKNLYESGQSSTQIAKQIGRSKTTILRSLSSSQVVMRRGGRYASTRN